MAVCIIFLARLQLCGGRLVSLGYRENQKREYSWLNVKMMADVATTARLRLAVYNDQVGIPSCKANTHWRGKLSGPRTLQGYE